jgi:hypothetical protein
MDAASGSCPPGLRRAVGVDDATWLRGRARALSMALGHLDYYRYTNPVMADNARYTIREVLADYHGTCQFTWRQLTRLAR